MSGASAIERSHVESVGEAHRRRHGQYMTPDPIARHMVRWAVGSGAVHVHDPAFGLGAFHRAASDAGAQCTGHEVDPAIAGRWLEGNPNCAAETVEVANYLTAWDERRHDAIVCNPPYMRFQKVRGRHAAFEALRRRTGVPLSGHANLASAFLLKSLAELSSVGRLAYLMPLEFLNAGYGEAVKARLLSGGHLSAVIQLACEEDAFPEVATTVGIILYDRGGVHESVRFASVTDLDRIEDAIRPGGGADVPAASLDPAAKWLPLFGAGAVRPADGMVRLSEYGRFKRGIATGANAFFALRPSEVRARGLPPEEAPACITRSADVSSPVLDGDGLRRLEAVDAKTRLFSPGNPPSPAADALITEGEAEGVHLRHLTSHRTPWHRSERRAVSPLWVGTFSRGGYKAVRNLTGALSLACFHAFEPHAGKEQWVDRLFLYLLSDAGRRLLALSERQYGRGLKKFEPNDLNGALAPSPAWLGRFDPGEAERQVAQVANLGHLPESVNERFAALAVEAPEGRLRAVPAGEGPLRTSPGVTDGMF